MVDAALDDPWGGEGMSIGLNHVSFAYDKTVVLQDVTWHLPPHGVVCLWGPSGCGKTTLLRLLAGLEKPQTGRIDGIGRVSMVFQEDRLLPWRTALENVTTVGADEDASYRLLSALGLSAEELHALPAHLSGGQQRRVALARALAVQSDVLLLDEPFNGLDEDRWQDVVPLILAAAESRPVVMVTHIREQVQALNATVVHLTEAPQCGEWHGVDFL